MKIFHLLLAAFFYFMSGAAYGQSWALLPPDFMGSENPLWSPDEVTLEDAMQKLSAEFRSAKNVSQNAVPEWNTYTLWYQGRVMSNSRILHVIGNCNAENNTVYDNEGEVEEQVIVLSDGGPCNFHARYDSVKREVVFFQFNNIR